MKNGLFRIWGTNKYWMISGRHVGVVTCGTVSRDGNDKIIISGGEDSALNG